MAYPFVESPNKTPTSGREIDVVVIHTMEIAERPDAAAICARWFATPASQVSAHFCVDAARVIQCVREKDVAWHARGGNAASVGVELAGFARQTAKQWDDRGHSRLFQTYRESSAITIGRYLQRMEGLASIAGPKDLT